MTASVLAAGVLEETIRAFFQGLPIGAGFALVAMSLALAYKTSGVFNLAFGAQAFISAATYFELHVRRDWPIWSAALLAVAVVAPVLGLVLERLVFRHVHAAPAAAKLVISLGLMVALPELFKLIADYNRAQPAGAVGIIPDGATVYRLFDRYPVTRDEIAAFAIAIAAAAALAALLRYTRLGLRIRAVVQSPRMTELNGFNADWVSSASWMLSSLLAGLAGVLLVPITPSLGTALEPQGYFPIVISALAAAALSRLASLPVALLGGLFLGVVTTEMRAHLSSGNVVLTELRGSALPYVMLFAVIALWPAARRPLAGADPLLGASPPPPALAAAHGSRAMTTFTRAMALAFLVAAAIYAFGYANDFWLSRITHAAIFSIIFLSIVVITGLGGQIALWQVTFAAVGAFAAMQFAQRWDVSVIVGMVAGAAIAAAAGAVLSIPVMRLNGIWLAVSTLAFALFFHDVLVKYDWVGGTFPPDRGVPRPELLGIDFSSHKNFLILCAAALAVVSAAVILIRASSTGLALRALRDTRIAAESSGVTAWRYLVIAFSVSGAIAAVGGGLLAMEERQVSYEANLDTQAGLFWLVIVVVLGARTVEGGIQAGVALVIFPELVLDRWLGLHGSWLYVLFGFAAISFARHPEGLLEHAKRRSQALMLRVFTRAKPPPAAPTPKGPAPAPANGAAERTPTSAAPAAPENATAPTPAPLLVPVLELRHVHAGYGPLRALFDISLTVAEGETVALLGRDGAGKTTVARVASGLVQPTDGVVMIDGNDHTKARAHRYAKAGVAHVPEGRAVFPDFTVEENLALAFSRTRDRPGVRDALDHAFELFPSIAERRRQTAGTLSGGEQRMLAMARALVETPRLLIADELSLGLAPAAADELSRGSAPAAADEVYAALARIRDTGTALLIVEQHMGHALALCDRAILLDHGAIAWQGPPDEAADRYPPNVPVSPS